MLVSERIQFYVTTYYCATQHQVFDVAAAYLFWRSRRKTIDLVTKIQSEIGITAMAHLPCIGFSRSEIAGVLDQLRREGLENVLALGGDPPKDSEDFVQPVEYQHCPSWPAEG